MGALLDLALVAAGGDPAKPFDPEPGDRTSPATSPAAEAERAKVSVDGDGRPLEQCRACGCPTWWKQAETTTWFCDHCTPRPSPFDRVGSCTLVTAGGEWGKH